MPEVIINGRAYKARVGEKVMDVARRNGAHMGFVCDGRGYCSTCECKVKAGEEELSGITRLEKAWLGESRLQRGYRLGCQAVIEGDGPLEVITRAEMLRRQFFASFAGGASLSNTRRFFGTLTNITVDHLSQAPSGVSTTFSKVGPLRFFVPWRNVGEFVSDTGHVVDTTLGGSPGPSKVKVEVEEIDEDFDEPFTTTEVVPTAPGFTVLESYSTPVKPIKPFDFLPIDDIGEVFNERLFEGGIYSYRQLAATSPEKLAEICETNAERVVRNQWREQATRLAGKRENPSTTED